MNTPATITNLDSHRIRGGDYTFRDYRNRTWRIRRTDDGDWEIDAWDVRTHRLPVEIQKDGRFFHALTRGRYLRRYIPRKFEAVEEIKMFLAAEYQARQKTA